MAITSTCITDLVGIVRDDCACYTGNCTPEQIAAMRTSKSGLFLEHLDGMPSLKNLQGAAACKNVCQITLDLRPEAETIAMADITAAIGGKYSTSKKAYNTVIGETAFTATIAPSKRYYGIRMTPVNGSRDTIIALAGISVNVTAGGGVNIVVVRQPKGGTGAQVVDTFGAQSHPGIWSPAIFNPGPTGELRYPLYVDGVEQVYYVMIDSAEMAPGLPVDNLLSCGCGGKDAQINQFVNIKGVQLDNLNDTSTAITSDRAFGVSLSVKFSCNEGIFVCREYDNKNPIAVALAHGIRYKMGALYLSKILSSPEVNRATMMNREQLYANIRMYDREYQKRVNVIANTVDVNSSDCFICNGAADLSITHIRL